MTTRYRVGRTIVYATIALSGIICLATVARGPSPSARAGQDLGSQGYLVGDFDLVERSGRPVNQTDLADRVWVASFIFTRCPLSCPRITTVMKGLQSRLTRTNALLVSLSVDPAHDTPDVLKAYAQKFGASDDRWWFLTGGKPLIEELVRERFKLPLADASAADQALGGEAISHSERLALVDRGRVVGFFDAYDPLALDALVSRAGQRAQPAWIRALPAVNAILNASCATLLVVGWLIIYFRPRRPIEGSIRSAAATSERSLLSQPAVRGHAICMVLAVVTSTIFLVSYLVYHYHAGSVAFRAVGIRRLVYFTILLSHTILATFGVVPLVTLTLIRAFRQEFDRHARIAQITLPIWLYVSVTGVVIYLLLYQLPVPSMVSQP